jgi:tetratricopeptide (TPR) repeat protein
VAPAWAVKEWYDHYADGEALLRDQKYKDALQSFQEAVKLKPESDVNARSYGMEFVAYLPYYKIGLCQLGLGDYQNAILMFNIEERNGAIKRSPLFTELVRRRSEAEGGQRAQMAQQTRTQIAKLEKEAAELQAARRYDEALALLAQATGLAQQLDPRLHARLVERRDGIRAQQQNELAAVTKTKRIDQELADGLRALEEGRPTDAVVRFDQVLALDAANKKAQDGRADAQERIRASQDQEALRQKFQQGKGLFDAGRYEEALLPLTDAAVDPRNAAARDLLGRAQKILEGERRAKEQQQRIDSLLAEAERLLAAEKYPEAQVKLEGVLTLDRDNSVARQRLAVAENKTIEAFVARFLLPNRAPALIIFEPRLREAVVEAAALAIQGAASDDYRVEKVEFLVDGKPLATQQAEPDPSGLSFNMPFQRVFTLQPGLNQISVVATDSFGLRSQPETFRITRRLPFYQTPAFLPAAALGALSLLGFGFAVQHWRRRRAVRSRFNPYIAGAPVMDDALFFGREKLLARIMNVLHHNSLMITGERRIGKTSFLYHLKKTLERDDGVEYRFFPVFTDMQGVSEPDFFHSLMGDVVDALRPNAGPLRYRPEHTGYDERDFSHDLQRVIEELKGRTHKKVKLALLIDEVDVLNDFSERVNQRLRSIFMKTFSENLVAIMSGVGIRRIWTSAGSPWYNFFDEVELPPFTREDAALLIRTPVEGIFRYEPQAVERILEWSELRPYLIQRFCIYSVNRIIEERRTTVTAADVVAVRDAVQIEGMKAEPPAPALRRQASA